MQLLLLMVKTTSHCCNLLEITDIIVESHVACLIWSHSLTRPEQGTVFFYISSCYKTWNTSGRKNCLTSKKKCCKPDFLPLPGKQKFIFCRSVLLYFRPHRNERRSQMEHHHHSSWDESDVSRQNCLCTSDVESGCFFPSCPR